MNQHALAGLEGTVGDHRIMHSLQGHGQTGRLFETHVGIWKVHDPAHIRHGVFGKGRLA